jgi:hypothetical protein
VPSKQLLPNQVNRRFQLCFGPNFGHCQQRTAAVLCWQLQIGRALQARNMQVCILSCCAAAMVTAAASFKGVQHRMAMAIYVAAE